jgi:cytochrome c oxidase subunit 2
VTNRFDFDVRDKGTYTGRCAEFCGLDHAKMTFEVKAVSMTEYRDWIAGQQRAQSGGSP